MGHGGVRCLGLATWGTGVCPERPKLKGGGILLQASQPELEGEVGREEGGGLTPPKRGDRGLG